MMLRAKCEEEKKSFVDYEIGLNDAVPISISVWIGMKA